MAGDVSYLKGAPGETSNREHSAGAENERAVDQGDGGRFHSNLHKD